MGHSFSPVPLPTLTPILLISFSSGFSVFSSGRSGQNLLLLGGGLGCFWRRMYSTERKESSE